MPLKVDMAARRALEAAATAQQSEKKKKRPITEAGQYKLKRIRRGPTLPAARSPPTGISTVVLEAIPLVRGDTAGPVRPELTGDSLPESSQERIRRVLLPGGARRFEIMTLQELGDWAFCFANLVSALHFSPWHLSLPLMLLMGFPFV